MIKYQGRFQSCLVVLDAVLLLDEQTKKCKKKNLFNCYNVRYSKKKVKIDFNTTLNNLKPNPCSCIFIPGVLSEIRFPALNNRYLQGKKKICK